jgi:prolyl-tRNA synthetase
MKDQKTVEIAEKLYRDLLDAGIEVLIDDRDERAGVKFKDADLIGIPVQVIIGEKNLKEGLIEIKDRRTKEAMKVKIQEAVEIMKEKRKRG